MREFEFRTESTCDRGPARPNGLRVEPIERAGSRAQTFADPLAGRAGTLAGSAGRQGRPAYRMNGTAEAICQHIRRPGIACGAPAAR
jgi:hypothetical protein